MRFRELYSLLVKSMFPALLFVRLTLGAGGVGWGGVGCPCLCLCLCPCPSQLTVSALYLSVVCQVELMVGGWGLFQVSGLIP